LVLESVWSLLGRIPLEYSCDCDYKNISNNSTLRTYLISERIDDSTKRFSFKDSIGNDIKLFKLSNEGKHLFLEMNGMKSKLLSLNTNETEGRFSNERIQKREHQIYSIT